MILFRVRLLLEKSESERRSRESGEGGARVVSQNMHRRRHARAFGGAVPRQRRTHPSGGLTFLFARGGKLRIIDVITGRGRRACSCNAAEEPRRRGPGPRACERGCRSRPSRAPRPHGRPPSPRERLFPAMIYVRSECPPPSSAVD